MHLKFCLLFYTNLFFIHYSNAFNITTILNQYPSFSIFNRYLSETNVSLEINSRQTITVLAVSNDDVWHLSGKQHEMLDNLMRVHVVLDYYDVEKLRNSQNGTTQMTTLFQTTGHALGQQGFLKATVSKTGNVVIGSATSGVPVGAILVNSVVAEPFNISVLHISTEIVPVGMNFPVVSDSNDQPAPSPQTSPPPLYPPRCRHKTAPSHARSSAPSPNPHGESPPEGAPGAPSSRFTNSPASAKSPPSLAPKLVPSHSRSPTPSPNPPPTVESPPKGAPTSAPSAHAPASTKSPPGGAPTSAPTAKTPTSAKSPPMGAPPSGGFANSPSSTKSPPGGAPPSAPTAKAPTSTKSPPMGAPTGAPSGGSANAPLSTKSPPRSAPPSAPSQSSANTPTSTKTPPEGATPMVAPSGGFANTPNSPPKSIETPPRSPPKLAETPAKPPPKPADTQRSHSGTSNSSLLVVVITIVLSCINLIIRT